MIEIPTPAFLWTCAGCGVDWPGPERTSSAVGFECPHCEGRCAAVMEFVPDRWPDERHVGWQPPSCSVPWSACAGCGRPWEFGPDYEEQRCFHCDVERVVHPSILCNDPVVVVLVVEDGDTRIYCDRHGEIAMRQMPRASVLFGLDQYLPAVTR